MKYLLLLQSPTIKSILIINRKYLLLLQSPTIKSILIINRKYLLLLPLPLLSVGRIGLGRPQLWGIFIIITSLNYILLFM